MGETRSPGLRKGENVSQLFSFKLFVFVILKPVWKQAGRGLAQKWGSHFFGVWTCELLRISASVSFPEAPGPVGCGWALQGLELCGSAGCLCGWVAPGKLDQQDAQGTWFAADSFCGLIWSHCSRWDGSSVRSVTSGIYPNVTPVSPPAPMSGMTRELWDQVQGSPALTPALRVHLLRVGVLGLTRKLPQHPVPLCSFHSYFLSPLSRIFL